LKNILQNQQANINQTWYISSLGEDNKKKFQIKGQVLVKWEIITKMQKYGKTFLHLLQWGKSLKISSRNHRAKKYSNLLAR
jgi:hypothetical protein